MGAYAARPCGVCGVSRQLARSTDTGGKTAMLLGVPPEYKYGVYREELEAQDRRLIT